MPLVREGILPGPALTFDACAGTESRYGPVKPRAQPADDTIEGAVLGLDAGDSPAAGVADRNATSGKCGHVAMLSASLWRAAPGGAKAT